MPLMMSSSGRVTSSTADDGGAEGRYDVGKIDHRRDVDAGENRGLLVPSDDEEIAAPRVLGEEDIKRGCDDEDHPEQRRHREPRPIRPGKPKEARAREAGEGVVVDRNSSAVGDQKADAA